MDVCQTLLARAKSNHFSALKQCGTTPNEYAKRMRILEKYHSQDIHQWTVADGKSDKCPWHPQYVCSCGGCDKDTGTTAGGTRLLGSGSEGSTSRRGVRYTRKFTGQIMKIVEMGRTVKLP